MNGGEHPDSEDLRVEYQACQASAEHHDQLVWIVTSVLWAASLVLLGFVLEGLHNGLNSVLITLVGVLGALVTVSSWRLSSLLRCIKAQKYQRCVQLEERLGLHQHRDLRYKSGSHQPYFNAVMVGLLLMWVVVIVYSWCVRP